MEWKKWCKLCATYCQDGLPLNEMADILKNNFSLELTEDANIPNGLCLECHQFLVKSTSFSTNCLQADKMFKEILALEGPLAELQLLAFRQKFGFDENVGPVEFKPNKLDIFENFTIKMEIDEEDALELQPALDSKKKSKPRKKTRTKTRRAAKQHSVLDDEESVCEDEMKDEVIAVPLVRNLEPMPKEDVDDIFALGAEFEKRRSTNAETNKVNQIFFKYDCHLCQNQSFSSFIKLSAHCESQHGTKPKVTCMCGSKLSCLSALSRHRTQHLANCREDKLMCKLCNEKFTRRMLLDDHIQKMHGLPSELPFPCSEFNCTKRFSTQLALRQHERIHMKDLPEDLMVACDKCDKKFATKNRLNGHILTAHIVDKNFICDECGNGFKTKGALTDHQNSHKKELIYQCDKCPKAFKHLRGIKRHLERHNRTEKFICAICSAQLSSKDVLAVHMLIHSDEKRFKCHLCTNAYKRTKNLKIHIMTVHTGGTPQYSCPWCDRTFFDGSNCYKHRKNSHPNEFAASQGKEVVKTYLPKLEYLQPQNAIPKRNQVESN